MSRYMPFGSHFFIMPTLQVVSVESLENASQTVEIPTSLDSRPAGPFAFHRMMSYRCVRLR
jgi:hypothetical protein